MIGVAKIIFIGTLKSLALLVIGFGASFTFLSYAMETLPMGTAYGIWTGIGASGEQYLE